ncbi:1,4-dihydroxy-2-naphthoate octaprenyltransferase [bacterium]|nr:1,4-dihydroxy-2-naphthoate octaprenyltransferase [bacterium]
MTTMALNQQVRNWAVAVRAYAYPASIVPVVLGTAYAWYATGRFNWAFFLLALIAGMLYHTGSNLVNDYYDYKYKVDREDTFGGSGMLVNQQMTMRQFARGSVVTLALGTLIGLYFLWHFHAQSATPYPFGWPLLAIGGLGLLGAVFYTATPSNAKYNALGEPLVFVMMGVGMVLGAYFVQAGTLSWNVVWVSLPVGFIVAAILQANDTRDIVDDRQANIKTFSTLAGATAARAFYTFLLIAPYLTVLGLVLAGVIRWPSLAVLLTLPLAMMLLKTFWTVRDEKSEKLFTTVELTAKLHLGFGLLLAIGVCAGHWF